MDIIKYYLVHLTRTRKFPFQLGTDIDLEFNVDNRLLNVRLVYSLSLVVFTVRPRRSGE